MHLHRRLLAALGAVRRQGVALRPIPFRAGESLVAAARPSQRKMCSRSMIVIEIRIEGSSLRGFMEHDHMIEALASNGSNHSLYIASLPRRAWCGQHFANAHVSHLFSEVVAKDPIAVTQYITRELVKGKCLSQWLSRPRRRRMGGHSEVQNTTPVMGQHQKHVKDLEMDGWHREEVYGPAAGHHSPEMCAKFVTAVCVCAPCIS
jgi:hypothetical protein